MRGPGKIAEVACFDERRPLIAELISGFLYEGYLDEDGEAF